MNTNEAIALQAGRELDALIAEKVMLNVEKRTDETNFQRWITYWNVPHYSTNMSDAWKIVEIPRLREFNAKVTYIAGEPTRFQCGFGERQWIQAETMPLAICRAALASVDRYEVAG